MPEERFNVVDPVAVGDLTKVSEYPLIPPTKRVKCVIKRITPISNKEKTWRGLSVGVQIKDGIQNEKGEIKYQHMYVNLDPICYYGDEKVYPEMTEDRRHLGKLKSFFKATGMLGRNVDDTLINDLKGKEVYADIESSEDKRPKSPTFGEPINRVVRVREVPIEEQV